MIEALQQHAATMHLMIDEMRAQRDDMRTFMDGVLDVLKNMTVTREIIRETVRFQPPEGDFEATGNWESVSQAVSQIAVPSKMEIAKQWLRDHPEDMSLTGRDLETLRQPMGVKISYRTWNDAKKGS